VEVAAVIFEARPLIRIRQTGPSLVVKIQRVGYLIGVVLPVMQIDPQQHRPTQPPGTIGDDIQMLDLVPVEDDGAHF
jgi:hypothetical protein